MERAKGAFEFDDCSWSIFDYYEYLKHESGSGKIADQYINTANDIIAGDSVAEAVATIESKMPNYKVAVDVDGNVTAEALARGIAALNKHVLAEAAQRASRKKLAREGK